MSRFAILSLAIGVTLSALYCVMTVAPASFRKGVKAYPRAPFIGWVFSAIAVFWAAWHLQNMSMGMFDAYKHFLNILAPVTLVLVILCMSELLPVRSLGAILILVPAPVLRASRMCDSPWRLVVVVLVYLIAIKGIYLVFSPHLFRQWTEKYINSDKICRLLGVSGLALMILVIALSLAVY